MISSADGLTLAVYMGCKRPALAGITSARQELYVLPYPYRLPKRSAECDSADELNCSSIFSIGLASFLLKAKVSKGFQVAIGPYLRLYSERAVRCGSYAPRLFVFP